MSSAASPKTQDFGDILGPDCLLDYERRVLACVDEELDPAPVGLELRPTDSVEGRVSRG